MCRVPTHRLSQAALLPLMLLVAGCSVFRPLPAAPERSGRLKNLPTAAAPLHAPLRIYWDAHDIPTIVARDDGDLAFGLGVTHAHLRLAQMELLRLVSQGRLSEVAGPFTADIDHGLRTLDFGRAVPEILAGMPVETRRWLDRYVQGINFFKHHAPRRPPELELLELREQLWTDADVVTISRLASTDVNWLYWTSMLRLREHPEWPRLRARIAGIAGASIPSFDGGAAVPLELSVALSKSGSNCFAVGGERTTSGAALIASDPHVGLMLPNLWVVTAWRSPGFECVGFSLPGVPGQLIGRNAEIGWGGTNMLSLSSSLYDVSAQAAAGGLRARREPLSIRWWFDRELTVRESSVGPVLTDVPFLESLDLPPLALRWMGHQPSDELTAILAMNRADGWRAFQDAFATWGVSGQNYVYGDRRGNIGLVPAVRFAPAAWRTAGGIYGAPANPEHVWDRILHPGDLPRVFNPPDGYIISCNNLPVRTRPPLAQEALSNDRFTRMRELLTGRRAIDRAAAAAIQQDVYSPSAHRLARAVARLAAAYPGGGLEPEARELAVLLGEWDGRFAVDSVGAAALQTWLHRFVRLGYAGRDDGRVADYLLGSPVIADLALDDLARDAERGMAALVRAARDFRERPTWGDLHRLRIAHPLSNVPLIGNRFEFGDVPVGGSSATLWKSAHRVTGAKHYVRYGQNARHISDLGDADANYFVLLGGQDGWIGSPTFDDQVGMWLAGEYVQVPLRLTSVRAGAVAITELRPPRD